MDDRKITFEGIQNTRDLGGLYTADGRMIAHGLLFRSANLARATPSDLLHLRQKLHIGKIIDLRTEIERSDYPDAVPENVSYQPIPIFDGPVAGISHEKSTQTAQGSAAIPKMEILYRVMVTEESCRRNFGKAAKCVMEQDFTEGGVLWHCTEGKDRCGLLTFILLSALYVDRRQIMEDYLLTNEVNGPKAEMYYQQIIASGKSEAEAAAVKDTFLAKASYLEQAFLAVDENYLSIEDFLCEGLHIPEEIVAKFRKNVLQ